MLETIFIMMLILAIILLVAAYEWEDPAISILDSALWFLLALGVLDIEIPYQYVSGGVVTEATQNITNLSPLGLLFMGIGIVMFVYFVTHATYFLHRY